jgi:hypothetical protein
MACQTCTAGPWSKDSRSSHLQSNVTGNVDIMPDARLIEIMNTPHEPAMQRLDVRDNAQPVIHPHCVMTIGECSRNPPSLVAHDLLVSCRPGYLNMSTSTSTSKARDAFCSRCACGDFIDEEASSNSICVPKAHMKCESLLVRSRALVITRLMTDDELSCGQSYLYGPIR